jgi:hypothetical protein
MSNRLHLVKSLHPEFLRLSPQEHRKLVEKLQIDLTCDCSMLSRVWRFFLARINLARRT